MELTDIREQEELDKISSTSSEAEIRERIKTLSGLFSTVMKEKNDANQLKVSLRMEGKTIRE